MIARGKRFNNEGLNSELAAVILSLISVLLTSVLIVRADTAYNQTYDEGAHIACGMEWLTHGTYTYETLHPPLGRVATAIVPYLFGARSQDRRIMAEEGTAILDLNGRYVHNLLLSRLGMLPFFWLTCLLAYLYMRGSFSAWHGAVSVLLLSFCPVVLAHSALATTDAPLMAMFMAAVLSFALYLKRPTLAHGLLAGATVGLACVTKFSAMPFFLLSAAILILHRVLRYRQVLQPVRQILIVGVLTLPIFWAAYRFSFAPLFTPQNTYDKAQTKLDAMSPGRRALLTKTRVPAPELFRGLYLTKQNGDGTLIRYGYLLGQTYVGGRWDFFPVGVLTKTPLAMILLCGLGFGLSVWRWRTDELDKTIVLFAGVAGPLVIGVTGKINIGLRHVLPIYPFLAMFGAIGALWLWQQGRYQIVGRVAVVLLLIWSVESCVAATPEFLPYFNELVEVNRGHVLVDSDLDWGQDYYKLETRLKDVSPSDVWVDYFGDETLAKHESTQWHVLEAGQRPQGWVAVSETRFEEHPELYGWLVNSSYTWVGRSIRLYDLRAVRR